MTLDFVWIDNYRVINEVGFNFSSEKIFHYSKSDRKLNITPNRNYIDSFYGKTISEVTAVIGENGVGKSTLFEFLIRNLASYGNGGGTIYEDGDFFAVFSNAILIRNPELITNKEELKKKGYKIVEFGEGNFYMKLWGTGYEKLSYAYYSNVFDYNLGYESSSHLIDISTNHLLVEDSRNSEDQIVLFMFTYNEIKRQIDFLADKNFDTPFKLPDRLYIEIPKNVYKFRFKITDAELAKIGLTNVVDVKKLIPQTPNIPHESAKREIFTNVLKYRSYLKQELYKNIKTEVFLSFYENYSDELKSYPKKIIDELRLYKSLMEHYDRLTMKELLSVSVHEEGIALICSIRTQNRELFDFINSVGALDNGDNLLYFSWPGLSSGEKAFLALLGRLNYAYKKIDKEAQIKDVLIMMDECDLYLHPLWQKNFLSILFKSLPEIFPGIKTQLILSSHSPFLTSDLLNSNIIFLRKEVELREEPYGRFKCVVDKSYSRLTFGSNIHSLFKESFYMHSGLMGQFANQKLHDLIRYLKGTTQYSRKLKLNKETSRIVIDAIGEPIIRNQLVELWNKKFLSKEEIFSFDVLKERVKELEQENTRLKNESNKNK